VTTEIELISAPTEVTDIFFNGEQLNTSKSSEAILTLPALTKGKAHVLTVLMDHMGQNEEAPGTDQIKRPRGVTGYSLSGHPLSDISWKLTGNLGVSNMSRRLGA
jgi:hypothetical protein